MDESDKLRGDGDAREAMGKPASGSSAVAGAPAPKARLRAAARILAIESEIRTLEESSLRPAHERIGAAYIAGGVQIEDLKELVARLAKCQSEIATVDREEQGAAMPLPEEPTTITDRAARVGESLRRRATRSSLAQARSRMLAELGEACAARSYCPPTVSDADLQHLHGLRAKLDSLRAEADELRGGLPWYLRRPRRVAALAAGLAIMGVLGVWALRPSPTTPTASLPEPVTTTSLGEREVSEYISEQMAETDAAMARLIEQQREIEAMTRAEEQAAEAESKRADVEAQLRQLELDKADIESRAKQRAELQHKDAEAQQRLAAMAQGLFESFDLEGSVKIASSRLRDCCPLEIRGQNAAQIIASLKSKNYLALLETLLGRAFATYPEATTLERARQVLSEHKFKVFVATGSTSARTPNGEQLMLVTMHEPKDIVRYGNSPFDVDYDWQADPTGRGVYIDWSPRDGRGMVVLMKLEVMNARLNAFREQVVRDIQTIRSQMDLGELSPSLADEQARAKYAEHYAALFQWVASQP